MDHVRSEAEHGYISLCHNGLQRCQTEFASQNFMFPGHEMRLGWVWSVTIQATWHNLIILKHTRSDTKALWCAVRSNGISLSFWVLELCPHLESKSSRHSHCLCYGTKSEEDLVHTEWLVEMMSKCLNLAPFLLLSWTWKANLMTCILPSGLGLWSSNLESLKSTTPATRFTKFCFQIKTSLHWPKWVLDLYLGADK